MNLEESIITMDAATRFSNPNDELAQAWAVIRKTLVYDYKMTKSELEAFQYQRKQQIEVIRQRIDEFNLTHEQEELLDDLHLPHQYDRRPPKHIKDCIDKWEELYGISPDDSKTPEERYKNILSIMEKARY